MLTKCKECNADISDKAVFCPHCGCPSKIEAPTVRVRKHDKLPNGFGRISRIAKCRLNPYRALTSKGKVVGYYKTYNKAYEALLNFNKMPYDVEQRMTMDELFESWMKEKAKDISKGHVNQLRYAWQKAKDIHDMDAKSLRLKHISEIIESDDLSANHKRHLGTIFKQMMSYATSHDIVGKNYADGYQIPKYVSRELAEARRGHISFTDDEMDILWKNLGIPGVDLILIGCYTGWRPKELLNIKKENVDLKEGTMTGGSKTESGKNRTIPVHSCIIKLVRERYGPKYQENSMSYHQYLSLFKNVIYELDLNPRHTPHDTRVQFVTMAKKSGMNDYAIKQIVGHKIMDVTERFYTKRDDSWLKLEIEKIKPPAFLNGRNGVRTFQI